MKTLTEFVAFSLKTAQKTKEELVAAGKTAEVLTAAMGESLKLEGDKLSHLISALDAVESKWDDLKRVVVLALNEGEAAPQNARQVGSFAFLVEHYGPVGGVKKAGADRDDKRRGGKGGRGGRDGRGGGGRGGERRPPKAGGNAGPATITPKA